MPTDPARVRRTDPGNPDVCPVWLLHGIYSSDEVKDWVREGCTTAGIGCIDCKQPIIDSVLAELLPLQERASEFEQDPGKVRAIIHEGSEAARAVARETLDEVRHAMGLGYT
jgi:tryptophanyl-tRNA synthetase